MALAFGDDHFLSAPAAEDLRGGLDHQRMRVDVRRLLRRLDEVRLEQHRLAFDAVRAPRDFLQAPPKRVGESAVVVLHLADEDARLSALPISAARFRAKENSRRRSSDESPPARSAHRWASPKTTSPLAEDVGSTQSNRVGGCVVSPWGTANRKPSNPPPAAPRRSPPQGGRLLLGSRLMTCPPAG